MFIDDDRTEKYRDTYDPVGHEFQQFARKRGAEGRTPHFVALSLFSHSANHLVNVLGPERAAKACEDIAAVIRENAAAQTLS